MKKQQEMEAIDSWMFRVQAHPGESFGHFMGRFRRANCLSSRQMSAMLGVRYLAVSYWEAPSRRRTPAAKDFEGLSQLTGVGVTQLQSMLMPKDIRLCLRTRLCALCYAETPFHKLTWQDANIAECDRHQCELLSMCPRCGSDFQLPAYWEVGQCDRCHLPFVEMSFFQDSSLITQETSLPVLGS
jgi:transcriptional regulator with XRE-family HTH domain